ncbi:hypothetical protein [sulfur-oxidizing endosymbiont of Gigantopelta aegis]|uniref:hypothetical protein n=1 Tax=sulfur-oxidizing endosymbiont of Gigantopelta aegis TaxID=2794934 RepID=UPI001FED1984|nr:hypothetical protein [sulfur-oxidizing endosymbiont of Gigantopelta aegis]
MHGNTNSFSLSLFIPFDHPSLEGHFPGNPIVPGVVILDQMIRLWQKHTGKKVLTINHAKFVQILRADIACSIHYLEKETKKVTFLIQDRAQNIISKGQFYYDS